MARGSSQRASGSSSSSSSSKKGGSGKVTKIKKDKKKDKLTRPSSSSSSSSSKKKKGSVAAADDDESIDDDGSEVGWNSEDEAAYGALLRKKKDNKTNDDDNDDDDDDNDDDDDDDDDDDGVMRLSDLLNKNTQSNISSNNKNNNDYNDNNNNNNDDDDDDNDDDDNTNNNGDDDGDDDDDDDDDDDELENVHERLLFAIDKFANNKGATAASDSSTGKKGKTASNSASQSAPESVYSSTSASVSMDALLSALGESSSLKSVKHKLTELEKNINKKGSKGSKGDQKTSSSSSSDLKVPTYVNKVVADRIERKVAYDKNKDEMNKWSTIVNDNRALKTLDLAQDKRQSTSYRVLLKKFTPENDMEKEVKMALYDTATDDKAAQKKEDDDLGHRNTDINELRQKQADLAKVKALLFYEQMKRHRLNKIKSKAYHRIKKRQRLHKDGDKHAEVDLDQEDSAEQENKEAMKRVEERMNLRHKNMSKWARMALEHSHQNKGLRDSYHEAVRLGNELSSKVNDINEGDESGSDSDGYNSNNGENSILMSATNSVLDGYRETNSGVQGKYKKLFDMDFMKKAAMEQRQRGLEEAKNVLREIEDMENEIDSDDNNDVDMENKLSHKKSSNSVSFNKKSKDGSMLVGKNRVKTSFSIPDMNENNNNDDDENTKYLDNDNNNSTDNPWLSLDADIDKKTIKSNKSSKAKAKTDFVRVQQTKQQPEKVNKIAGRKQKEETEIKETSEKTHDEKANLKRKLTDEKSTVDMVNLAFAGLDYEAEFKASKKQAIDQELGVDEKKMQILSQVKAGWGDWAGPGNNGVSKKTLAKRDILLQQLEKDAALKKKGRQDSKIMNVIISDRRIKTSAKFKISEIPHPFTSIAEYEQSLQVPIGPDWNSSQVVKKNTNPDVITRSGRVIEAMRLK